MEDLPLLEDDTVKENECVALPLPPKNTGLNSTELICRSLKKE
jgi:hypothetical protein